MILSRANGLWHLYPLCIKLNQRSDPGKFSLSLLYEIPVFKQEAARGSLGLSIMSVLSWGLTQALQNKFLASTYK